MIHLSALPAIISGLTILLMLAGLALIAYVIWGEFLD